MRNRRYGYYLLVREANAAPVGIIDNYNKFRDRVAKYAF
jgi:hypothetical protein